MYKAEGGEKEVRALLHAQATDDGGHPNVVRYFQQFSDASFVYIVMELCDETLEMRIRRGDGFAGTDARRTACLQLCQGRLYLHSLPEAITHRDLKPSNLLFKGDTLKIADMGQSRILAMGETAVTTGSQGGTMGWMSPEEIARDDNIARGVPFEAHLSGDVHTAGSIIFYVLSGGVHCFGKVGYRQQAAISDGTPDFSGLQGKPLATDLVARMVPLEPARRLKIADVVAHPLFWTDARRVDKIRGWKTAWRRGPALDRRLHAHDGSVRRLVGGDGWVAALDPLIAARLADEGRHEYSGAFAGSLVQWPLRGHILRRACTRARRSACPFYARGAVVRLRWVRGHTVPFSLCTLLTPFPTPFPTRPLASTNNHARVRCRRPRPVRPGTRHPQCLRALVWVEAQARRRRTGSDRLGRGGHAARVCVGGGARDAGRGRVALLPRALRGAAARL